MSPSPTHAQSPEPVVSPAPAAPSPHPDLRFRWVILGMLFASTFLNYFDRQTLSVLKPIIKTEFGLDDNGYAHIVTAFLVTYAIAYTLGGRFVEWVGNRVSMTVFVATWSLANLATGLVTSVGQLTACRVLLGAAEPGNYPAALRVTVTWFPAKLRGLASSIYQSGSATAAVLALPVIAAMAHAWGWRTAFILPGLVGLVWAVLWWRLYRAPSTAYMPAETADILPRTPWLHLFRERTLWGIVLARLFTDQVWYFCLFWMPGYLQENLHLSLVQAGMIGWVPFLFADLGGIASGVASDRLVKRGYAPWRARRRILILTAFAAPVALVVPWAPHYLLAIAAFCVVATVCQIWLFNITTLVGDTFPRSSVSSVLGIAGSFGAIGGMVGNQLIGTSVGTFGFTPVFVGLSVLHLIGAGILFVLVRPAQSKA